MQHIVNSVLKYENRPAVEDGCTALGPTASTGVTSGLKGLLSGDFRLKVFSRIRFLPGYPIMTISNFFENSRRYSQLKVDTGGKSKKSSIRKFLGSRFCI